MEPTKRRVVIVGAGYAGVLCAARLSRKLAKRGRKASIVLVDPRTHFVERVRLHEDAAAGTLRRRIPLDRMLRGCPAVELERGLVRDIDLEGRRLRIEEGVRSKDAAFDDLVIATGSTSAGENIPGVSAHARFVATEEDALELMAELERRPDARVVVCGGGLTGIELATELAERRRSLRVSLATGSAIAPSLSESARVHVRAALSRAGVTLIENERIAAVENGAVVLEGGNAIAADVVVWCTGFRASALPREIGLAVDSSGRAFVDDRLRSRSHSFIRVVGDAARFDLALANGGTQPLRMSCATANPMGAFCADDLARNILGDTPESFRFDYKLQCVSLGRRDAVVQRVDADDAPISGLLRGRPAAWFKEALCRFAVGASALELMGIPFFWPRRKPALPSREVPSLP